MNLNYRKINTVMVAVLMTLGTYAQTPQMVKDINTTVNGGFTGSYPGGGVVLGTNLYFTATNKANGQELWKTDGTSAGTVLVKDINPGIGDASPDNLMVFGSNLYFSANDGINGVELWKTDGTTAGTSMVQDINAGPSGSNPGGMVALGGFVYFAATDNVHGNELWRTNGTTVSLVTDIYPGAASSDPSSLTVLGSALVFSADDGTSGNELWTSNGTTTSLLKDIQPAGSSSPGVFCVNGANLYFRATTSAYGKEPWVSDGTTAGTHLLSDMNPGTANTTITDFRPLGANTLIAALVGSISHEWYVTNGTTVTLVKDINPNPYYSGLSGQIGYELGGFIYFGANDATGQGTELWRTDGTLAGTTMVKDMWPGGGDGYPYNFSKNNLGGFMYFCANNGTDGYELWKTDGTAAGTTQVKNISYGNSDSNPESFSLLGTQFIFSANNDSLSGSNAELWKTDGTSLGTTLVKNIYPDTVTTANGFYDGIGVNGNALYFSADDGNLGRELYISSGTTAGTQLLKDINPGTGDSYPESFTTLGAVTFFKANDGTNGTELWKTDGTAAGTVLVKDIYPGSSGSGINYFKVLGNFIYFGATDGVNGYELWRSDGTAAGTTMVMDINTSGDSYPYVLAVSGGFLYFGADDGANGYELWKTDGVTTTMVMDLNPGSGSGYPDAEGTFVLGSSMYFTADDGTSTKVWKTDGITTTSLGMESGNVSFAVLNNKIYFSAIDAVNGEEIWYSDGTTTALVKDIEPGIDDSGPYGFTASGNVVYFIAYNNATGKELWETDGTAAGTLLVKDIAPGSGSANIDYLFGLNGRIYFDADDNVNGKELWQSDGTIAGTVMFDLNTGSNPSYPGYFAAMNGSLYFGAETYLNGLELWKLTPSNLITTASVSPTYCAGAAISVPFTTYGTINAGNVYTAELSDANGNFTSPVNIGTLNSTVLTGSITATLPNTATTGTAYRVRVKASNIATTGLDNGTDITVNALPSITATAGSSTICVGNSTTITAGGATTYTWSTSAHTTSIVVTPTANITYTVSGTSAAGCTTTVSVSMVVNNCVGINEINSNPDNVTVYPNPANSFINVDFSMFNDEEVLIEISNTTGQIVLSQKINSQHISLNIQQLNTGLYFIKTLANGRTNVARFIKE